VPQHLAALNDLGPSIHHRSLYAPVVAARMKRDGIVVEADMFADPLIALPIPA
jgi:ribonuclease HII